VSGACESDNELSSSIKYGEFLDLITNNYILKKDNVPWNWLANYDFQRQPHSPFLHVIALDVRYNITALLNMIAMTRKVL
jgi:hypothetical protein